MQIQNINSTNFTGGYKFIGMQPGVREELDNVVKKGKTIYDSYQGNPDDVFMVAKDRFHKAVLLFIKKHNLNCKYYPGVKSEMDFKPGHPEKLEQIVATQTPEDIVFDEELNEMLFEYQRRQAVSKRDNSYLSDILRILKLDIDESTHSVKRGVQIFQNKNHTQDIYVSPPDGDVHYVKIFPKVSSSSHDAAKRYAINLSNKVITDYTYNPAKWTEFNQKFSKTLIK